MLFDLKFESVERLSERAKLLLQKQKGKSATARQLLIVGNSAGQLAAYDAALGQKVWQSAAFHEGYVHPQGHRVISLPGHAQLSTVVVQLSNKVAEDDCVTLFYLLHTMYDESSHL